MFYFHSISEFFAMGGHGFYVWLCYLITFIAMISLYILSKRSIGSSMSNLNIYYRRLASHKASLDERPLGTNETESVNELLEEK